MKTGPNETAFPIQYENGEYESGLTKREYFAAIAMSCMEVRPFQDPKLALELAETAVQQADALIEALDEQQKPETPPEGFQNAEDWALVRFAQYCLDEYQQNGKYIEWYKALSEWKAKVGFNDQEGKK